MAPLRDAGLGKAPAEVQPHPLDQVDQLEGKIAELSALGDIDGVIEYRIKQLAIYRVLHELHGHPLAALAVAHTQLGEAYATGQYLDQAYTHWQKAKALAETAVYDDTTAQRLEVPLLGLEGFVLLQSGQVAEARGKLEQALESSERVFGDHDARRGGLHELLGRIACDTGAFQPALSHYHAARAARSQLLGHESEAAIRLWLQIAQVHHLAGDSGAAQAEQAQVCAMLGQSDQHPALLVEALQQLAAWQEDAGRYDASVATRQQAETVVVESCGLADPKTIQIKRDSALLLLKQGHNERALQHLTVVEALERQLYGSSSLAVARTLKAVGTVHLVLQAFDDAEQCLRQALQVFEANQSHPQQVEDIRVKLAHIASVTVPAAA